MVNEKMSTISLYCHPNSRRIHLHGLPQRELDINFIILNDWLLCSTIFNKLNNTVLCEPFQISRDLLDVSVNEAGSLADACGLFLSNCFSGLLSRRLAVRNPSDIESVQASQPLQQLRQ